ncbi:B12-binding domain-containing radical SAM protein [Mongoliitalea daihaiensis]|uniref:B12-binding domain-containing radical SAM protein n=1 Tax=Mongoliitalea daihaiensis TaxID=2782006 RepID=UPI001F39B8DF|nr:radical SAM protein [Mongoliitalea daihaiensis]UJP63904.1 radical SAM protein [Mongoliitalea daihaiensis]
MAANVLLLTPPFTQLNTPYPATAYIKGFLNTLEVDSYQADLGIEVILKLFSRQGIQELFDSVSLEKINQASSNAQRIYFLREEYTLCIEPVINFLQFKNPTLAYTICDGDFLPQASRFEQLDDLEWAFGTMGVQDKARHLATLYLEDIGDFIQELVDPFFGFSRYAERLGRSAVNFDPIEAALQSKPTYIDTLLLDILKDLLEQVNPTLVCMSVPFPGNLYGAFRIGKFIKENYPSINVAMGGGYPNTELRSLKEPRVFKYIDFITLDDGERPLQNLLEYLNGKRSVEQLKRTYVLQDKQVIYKNKALERDIPFSNTGTPDYKYLPLNKYLSVIEIANPMHRLWSDGRWNKLTMAHGCYWKKCTFCDITLDYIKNYEPISASIICDRIEELITQTGETGFHFVDEAAPPALMRELALEILKRKLKISWWTNIRFEERFTYDLCRLLKASGCIAVSGGLEVASDRLLELMKKGVTVAQVARVANNFTASGIMVHAYLMYGFPTQTAQETIDSLEMVRQLFEEEVLQSGFWHLFAMTSHAPIGLEPDKYKVIRTGPEKGLFADNDLSHEDPLGTEHERFSQGLKKALFNYMHGICMDYPLQEWFDFKVPKPTVPKNFIHQSIHHALPLPLKQNHKAVWLGGRVSLKKTAFQKKGKKVERFYLEAQQKTQTIQIKIGTKESRWIEKILNQNLLQMHEKEMTFMEFSQQFEEANLGSLDVFIQSSVFQDLSDAGLLWV